MARIAKFSHLWQSAGMKTQTLNVNLTAELRNYIKQQVRDGRYQNENEVVRDAIRQMQQHEVEQFDKVFGDYPGAPAGEPTHQDQQAIKSPLKRHHDPRRPKLAA